MLSLLLASATLIAADAPVLSDLNHARAETLSARYDAADAKKRPVADFELGQPGEGDVK